MRDTHANTKRRNFEKFPLFLIHCIKIVRGDVGKKYKKKKKFEIPKKKKYTKRCRLIFITWSTVDQPCRSVLLLAKAIGVHLNLKTNSLSFETHEIRICEGNSPVFYLKYIFFFFFFNSSIKTILSQLNPQRVIPTIMASFCAER